MDQLTIADLARGLEHFGERYNAFDVFADDIVEIQSGSLPKVGKDRAGDGTAYEIPVGGKSYYLRVFADAGVVRLSRKADSSHVGTSGWADFGAVAGAAIEAAAVKKGEGVVGGLLLGLLIGPAVGVAAGQESIPHRVFTLRFDPSSRTWTAYSGALVRWMKSELSSAA